MNQKIRLGILLTCFSLLFISSVKAMEEVKNYSEVGQELDDYFQALTKLNRFSGAVIVAKDNEILLNKAYGFANYEFDIQNTDKTKFRICSITKMVTAVAILQLCQENLLKLDDTISKFFPDFRRGDEITIHNLLTHTSGLCSENLPLEMVIFPTTLKEIYLFLNNKALEFEPGSDYRYSNANYFMLSHIIEQISGVNYEDFINENILVPLNMRESFLRESDYEIVQNCASGYCFDEKNKIVNGQYIYENMKGSGSLFCTAHDLYLFAQGLIEGKLINEHLLNLMFTIHHRKEDYGYGCQIRKFLGHNYMEHGGMLSSGFKSNLSLFIEDGLYIVILSNFFSSWVNEARDAVAAIILDKPYDYPTREIIELDYNVYDDFVGLYDHPSFRNVINIKRINDRLFIPEQNLELSPIAKDQFMIPNGKANNVVYIFSRDELGSVNQLKIKGGTPYFAINCEKLNKIV